MMKKSIILFAMFLALGACKKDISSLNVNTKKPASVPAGTLFNYAVKSYTDTITSASVNIDIFRFTVSHWAMTTYQDETQYDFTTRDIPQNWWRVMYSSVLRNLSQATINVNADATLDAGVKANQLAILDVMQVLAYSTLVNTFGDVPYSQALDATNFFPKYDDAKTISLDLLKRLNADIAQLNAAKSGFSAANDLIFQGDVSKWIKFANSLRMQQGLILADVDNATAKAAVEASDAGAISSSADNALFTYLAGAPNQNPLYVDIVTGGRGDYVVAADLVDALSALNDPRLSLYCSKNDDGNYVGGVVGAGNVINNFSQPNPQVYAETAKGVLMDYAETEFYRAEAAERGYAVNGTAETHYNNAITASILYWGGTMADANAYLAQPKVAYTNAASGATWQEKIGTQKWIALYSRPFTGWTELRRLDYPKITAPVNAISGFPNRFTYPSNEQQLNGANYTKAAATIGGDKVETKLFWDIH